MTNSPKASLQITPGHHSLITSFDVDYYGQDDGLSTKPEAAFRFLFQLGSGLMIYLYVIGVAQPGPLEYFHTFWIKDCAAVEIDMEELGAPDTVSGGPFALPIIYPIFVLRTPEREETFVVERYAFEARTSSDKKVFLQMHWGLDGADLYWNNLVGWHLKRGNQEQILQAGDRVSFRGA